MKYTYTLILAFSMFTEPGLAGDGSLDPATGNMELQVNFRYPPTSQQIVDAKAALSLMNQMICDATDGQIAVSHIRLTGGTQNEDAASFWYLPSAFRSGGSIAANGSSLTTLGSHMALSGTAQFQPDVLAHELGHHAFGLGEQYNEQRRGGGACGIGPGFENDAIDEQNHSLMQQSGAARCVGGADADSYCRWNAECDSNSCQPNLMSEFSVASNHDLLRGNGVCPLPAATTKIEFFGVMRNNDTMHVFDGTDWGTAAATSSARRDVELIDQTGVLPGHTLTFFASRTGLRQWQISAAIDDGLIGGVAGQINVLEVWIITFSADGSLNTVSESPARVAVSGLSNGAPDLDIQIDFGTPGATDWRNDLVTWTEVNGAISYLFDSHDGIPHCTATDCALRWNSGTNRYETTSQSLLHNFKSDWETIAENYPFVVPPAGLPVAAPPARCLIPPAFTDDVSGSDQVLLVMDRSYSMSESSSESVGEVCGNGTDDDNDGSTDESACAESRISFVQSAARAFADLQVSAGIDIGLLQFNHMNSVVQTISPLSDVTVENYKTLVDGLFPSGNTAIGDALEASKAQFAAVAGAGRSQTAFLLTDGFNNTGSDPEAKVQELKDAGIRVFTIPAGSAADVEGLSEIASRTGGYMISANPIDELPAVFAELASQYGASGLVLKRTPFTLLRKGEKSPDARIAPEKTFVLPVEKGAESLVAFISGRNGNMGTWKLGVELMGPDGSRFDSYSPQLKMDPYYVFFRIPNPAPGNWKLRAIAGGASLQESIALAFVDNPKPRLLADVRPRSVLAGKAVRITATPVFVTQLEGNISIRGVVKRPDGTHSIIALKRNSESEDWAATFSDFRGRGVYEIDLELDVGPGTLPFRGEPIFEGPERLQVEVVPFKRFKTLSFVVTDGEFPKCSSSDCDHDGIPNDKECQKDVDSDGIPGMWDANSDNDETSDRIEGLLDRDKNKIPDACDPKHPPATRPGPPYIGKIIREEADAGKLFCLDQGEQAAVLLAASIRRLKSLSGQLNENGRKTVEKILGIKVQLEKSMRTKAPLTCKAVNSRIQEALKLEEALERNFSSYENK